MAEGAIRRSRAEWSGGIRCAIPPYLLWLPANSVPTVYRSILRLMRRMETSTICQVVMATHSPLLMAYPNATLLRLSNAGLSR